MNIDLLDVGIDAEVFILETQDKKVFEFEVE